MTSVQVGRLFMVVMGLFLVLGLAAWALGIEEPNQQPRAINIDCGKGNMGVLVYPSSPHYDLVYEVVGGDGSREVPNEVCQVIMGLR